MKKYEESGAAWIGQVPSNWQTKKLKHFASVETGNTPPKDDDSNYEENGTPWIKPDNLNGFTPITDSKEKLSAKGAAFARIIPKGSVLVCGIGTIGKLGVAGSDLTTNQQINSVIFDADKIEPEFGKYLLWAGQGEMQRSANKVVVAILSKSSLLDLIFPFPPLPEQRAIAAYLDRKTAQLDTLLAQKEALLQMLHQKRQALINEAVTQGLDPAAPRKPSGVEWLGDVPAHWETTQLKHVTDFINGAPFKPENWVDEGIPIVRIQNLNGNVNFNCIAPQTEVKESCHLYGGELLFSWSGNVGTSFGPFMWEREGLSYLNQHIFKLANYQLHQKYFYWLLKAVTKYIESKTHGIIGMVHVTKPELGAVPIPRISFEEQGAIADYLDHKMGQVDDVATAIHTQIKTLKAYRQSLISEVVTGKVDVRTAAGGAAEAGLPPGQR